MLTRLTVCMLFYAFPKQQILNSSKVKQSADDNFKFDENSRKFSKWVENTVVTRNCSFSHSVFERLVSQTHQKVSLCGNGLSYRKNPELLGFPGFPFSSSMHNFLSMPSAA